MPEDSRFPSWEHIEEYTGKGTPLRQTIVGEPGLELYLSEGAGEMGLRIPTTEEDEPFISPLKEIQVQNVLVEDKLFLQIGTQASRLFKPFYHFVSNIADLVQVEGRGTAEALQVAVRDWSALLVKESLMSEQVQVGLFGELLVLERLIDERGRDAFESWTGPLEEPHDFRMVPVELEVKTTKGTARQHIISSLKQLVPSEECSLFIMSVVLEPGGDQGETLPERIQTVRNLLRDRPEFQDRFNDLLRIPSLGYRDEDAIYYTDRYRLRYPFLLVRVDENIPAITREKLGAIFPKEVSSRVLEVTYRLDIEGLGILDGEEGFGRILSPQV